MPNERLHAGGLIILSVNTKTAAGRNANVVVYRAVFRRSALCM